VADDKDRGQLIQKLTDAGIPFDASSHVDQLQATVDRLPLLLAEHERRGQAEAGEPTVPVSVDPGPDRTGNKLKGEVGSPDDFPGGSSSSSKEVEAPPKDTPPKDTPPKDEPSKGPATSGSKR
jgi:hypothetical protein